MDVGKKDWCVHTMHFCSNGKYIFMINKEKLEAIVLCWGLLMAAPQNTEKMLSILLTLCLIKMWPSNATRQQAWNSAALKGDVVVVIFGSGFFL